MSQVMKLDVFYAQSPERVWQALTDPRALAAWLMDNTFEPRVGHRFQFQCPLGPGEVLHINCQVIELEELKRLVYTWEDSPKLPPSYVIWTLEPVAGGTQLRLEHQGTEVQGAAWTQVRKTLQQQAQEKLEPRASLDTAIGDPLGADTLLQAGYAALQPPSPLSLDALHQNWEVALNTHLKMFLIAPESPATQPHVSSRSGEPASGASLWNGEI